MTEDGGYVRLQRDIKLDEDYLALTRDAQWLYGALMVDVDFIGVAEWKPSRLTKRSVGTTLLDVERAAAELQEKLFIVVDRDTEEVLIRTFVKYDGLYKQPNMCVAMVKAFRKVGSPEIRGVISHELNRISATVREKIDASPLTPAKKKAEHEKADHCWNALSVITSKKAIDPADLLNQFVESFDEAFEEKF